MGSGRPLVGLFPHLSSRGNPHRMVVKDVCGMEAARCPAQCLAPSRYTPDLAVLGSWLLLQGLTLFPPWVESPLKESTRAQVSGRTPSFTEHLMGEAEKEFYITSSVATHLQLSADIPVLLGPLGHTTPSLTGSFSSLTLPPRDVFHYRNMSMSTSPNLLFLLLLSSRQLPLTTAYRHVQCSTSGDSLPSQVCADFSRNTCLSREDCTLLKFQWNSTRSCSLFSKLPRQQGCCSWYLSCQTTCLH